MQLRPKRHHNTEPHTGALNDILFILLFFFLIVSTLANPNVIKLTQPKAKTEAKAKQNIVISIDKDMQLYFGQKPIDATQITALLEEYKSQQHTSEMINVVINADKSVSIEKVVQVMEIVKSLGMKTLLSVSPK